MTLDHIRALLDAATPEGDGWTVDNQRALDALHDAAPSAIRFLLERVERTQHPHGCIFSCNCVNEARQDERARVCAWLRQSGRERAVGMARAIESDMPPVQEKST